jgi:rRNA-processing protein FCF1
LARAGLLEILQAASVEPVLVDVVRAEIVDEGRQGGHPDAAALSAAVAGVASTSTGARATADARVLEAAQAIGLLVANDLALGRRARSLGVAWIRTADLILIAVKNGSVSMLDGGRALSALVASGRVTPELADAYREQLR